MIEYKDIGLTEVKMDAGSDAGTFSGYGAIFGNVDAHGDKIQKGAFAETLTEWKATGKLPKMLLQHGGWGMSSDDMMPVGQWTSMEENNRGLKVEGRLFAMNTERGQYLYEGLKAGELDSLSIGYETREAMYGEKPTDPRRTLTNIKLWEVSIVTFPANDKAKISTVKSLTIQELREYEDYLREAGLSQKEAVTASSVLKKWLPRDAGAPTTGPRDEVAADKSTAELLKALDGLTDRFQAEVFR